MSLDVYVGCDPNGHDAEQQMVLEHSLRKHASLPVRIHWMRLSNNPNSPWAVKSAENPHGWDTSQWSTTFSGFRWAIPQVCGFRGRAMYCDADFIFQSDIKEIFTEPFSANKIMLAKGGNSWRFCLTLWDNFRAKAILPDVNVAKSDPLFHKKAIAFFSQNRQYVQPFLGSWNCVDGEKLQLDEIDAVHYSDMRTQMSHRYSIPRLEAAGERHWFDGEVKEHDRKDLIKLFDDLYQEAISSGRKVEDYIPKEKFGTVNKETQIDYKR